MASQGRVWYKRREAQGFTMNSGSLNVTDRHAVEVTLHKLHSISGNELFRIGALLVSTGILDRSSMTFIADDGRGTGSAWSPYETVFAMISAGFAGVETLDGVRSLRGMNPNYLATIVGSASTLRAHWATAKFVLSERGRVLARKALDLPFLSLGERLGGYADAEGAAWFVKWAYGVLFKCLDIVASETGVDAAVAFFDDALAAEADGAFKDLAGTLLRRAAKELRQVESAVKEVKDVVVGTPRPSASREEWEQSVRELVGIVRGRYARSALKSEVYRLVVLGETSDTA